MGYTTTFRGRIEINPPLNEEEIRFINNFSATRRMDRKKGPYYCGTGFCGQDREPDVVDYNEPPKGQPGLWCQWISTSNGKALVWDGCMKFYNSAEWMKYVIDHFLKPKCKAIGQPYAKGIIYGGHVLNGRITAKGEDRGDRWELIVTDNKVTTKKLKKDARH